VEPSRNVIGVPGGGLVDASWAACEEVAEVGRRGELLTAAVLDPLAGPAGPTVLHDLLLSAASGVRVNVDHVVVSGRRVLLVESKCWRPGRYWTALGRTCRGLSRVPHADKRGGIVAMRNLQQHILPSRAVVVGPVYVIWPSAQASADRLAVRWYRPPVGRAMTGAQFARKAARMVGRAPADPALVSALLPLVVSCRRYAIPPAVRPLAPTAPSAGRLGTEEGLEEWPDFEDPHRTGA
jgi:hypothetical protein